MAFLHVWSALVFLAAASQAQMGNNPTAVANGRAVNQTCLALAESGSCEFYQCFENRLPCGSNAYILNQGKYYCDKMKRFRSTFTSSGQTFLDNASRCLTRSLVDEYQVDSINCETLAQTAVDAIRPCFIENNFCDIAGDDASRFFNIFEFSDLILRGAMRMWSTVTGMAADCATQRINGISARTNARIRQAFNNLFNINTD